MKRYIGLSLALLVTASLFAQNTVKMSAIKSNDYGVAYSLPKTEIVGRATYTKTTRKVGEFYRFAERYLSVTNPITQDEIVFNLTGVDVKTKGIPDTENSYLVEFKSNSVAPFVVLTKDGIICAINEEASFSDGVSFPAVEQPQAASKVNPRSYLSEEILRAGSTAKQAELIAKQIYRLRESKTNILTGEADNMPPDGDAYKLVMGQIDEQEKALTSMFVGTETTEILTKEFTLIPTTEDINNKIVFRFSSKLGIVEASDLAGAPVRLSLVGREPKAEMAPLTPKEQKAWDEKFSKGIIYNVQAKANLKIDFDGRSLFQKEIDIVQFGTREVLTPRQFEGKTPIKVVFYPDLGAIKQIIQ